MFLSLFITLCYNVVIKGPLYNWDIVPYMAIVKNVDENNFEKVSISVYNELENKLTNDDYDKLTKSSKYRKDMFNNHYALEEQISFYRLKVIYNITSYICNRIGFDLSNATVVPNYISYFLIGILFFYFLSTFVNSTISLIVTIGIMATEQVIQLARLSTPDALSTLVILFTVYCIYNKKSVLLIYTLLLLSVMIRPDNILFVPLMSIYFYFTRSGKFRQIIIFSSLIIIIYVSSELVFPHPGWETLFYHAFVERVTYPVSNPQSISLEMYVNVISQMNFKLYSFGVILIALIIQSAKQIVLKSWSNGDLLFYLLFAWVILKRIIFPINDERFYISIVLIFIIFMIKNLNDIIIHKKSKLLFDK